MTDVNNMKRIAAIRKQTRDLEVVWLCDLAVELVGRVNALDNPPDTKHKDLDWSGAPAIPKAVIDEFETTAPVGKVGVPGDKDSQDRKAYMREYMRKKRAEGK